MQLTEFRKQSVPFADCKVILLMTCKKDIPQHFY
nr:MAG TPA: hypothetical protein [Caudoviricetes sp.]